MSNCNQEHKEHCLAVDRGFPIRFVYLGAESALLTLCRINCPDTTPKEI